jgi:uncharacterized membrane protein
LPDPYAPTIVRVVRRPLHPIVLGLPFAAFGAALITDIAYYDTVDITWKNFSDWLLAGGMVLGALAAIVGIVDLSRRSVRANGLIWPYAIGYAVAMVLALINNFVHSRDAYGAMPEGLTLSTLTVIVLTITSIMGALLLRGRRTEVIA